MPRGIPGSGPKKTVKKSATGRKVTKTTKPAAARTAKKTARKSPKKSA